MEKTKHPLDNLLKQQLEHFSPEVPANLFSSLKTKVSAQQANGIISKTITTFKQASILLKSVILTVLIIPAAIVIVTNNQQKTEPPKAVSIPASNKVGTATIPASEPILSKPIQKLQLQQPTDSKLQYIEEPEKSTLLHEEPFNKIESPAEQIFSPTHVNHQELEKEAVLAEPLDAKSYPTGNEHTTENNISEPLVIPNAFSPNSDGINDEFEIILGHTQYQLKEQARPSMAAGYIYLNR
jgi:hypothetical protein